MSGMYGATSEDESVATIQSAIERGVTLIDTGDFYGMGHNEMLIGRAIKGRRDKVEISVKFGALRGPDGSWLGVDNRPAAVSTFLAYSLKRLGVDHVDVYRPARLDPKVPIEETIGAIADLVKAGYVRKIGLSEVGADTIRRANEVHPITDLQIEYSPVSRVPEKKIFPTLHELGISATLYSVLGRGLLTGSKAGQRNGDYRGSLPRFSADNRATNEGVVERIASFAKARKMTPAQTLIAWALAKEPKFVPVIGVRTREQLDDSLGALTASFSADDVRALEDLVPHDAIAGDRYQTVLMAHLDSEK
jgi:aryl-alcohol dehydrogenase-like predicted oxidoreductase